MKGTILKIKDDFGVGFTSNKSEKFIYTILPLNPYQITDGLEVGMEVEFEIEKFWETGIEEPFDVASLIIPFISDNIQTDGK